MAMESCKKIIRTKALIIVLVCDKFYFILSVPIFIQAVKQMDRNNLVGGWEGHLLTSTC